MEKERYIKSEYVEFWLEDGIIYENFNPELKYINLTIAKSIIKDRLTVSNGEVYPLLVELSVLQNIDKEARDYFISADSMQLLEVSALVATNYMLYIFSKVHISVHKPPIKVEVFKNRIQAKRFLKNYWEIRNT